MVEMIIRTSAGVELILYLRKRQPELPIIYLANIGRSTPEEEAQLPPIFRFSRAFCDGRVAGQSGGDFDGKGDKGRR